MYGCVNTSSGTDEGIGQETHVYEWSSLIHRVKNAVSFMRVTVDTHLRDTVVFPIGKKYLEVLRLARPVELGRAGGSEASESPPRPQHTDTAKAAHRPLLRGYAPTRVATLYGCIVLPHLRRSVSAT